jgi:hypothetical protein
VGLIFPNNSGMTRSPELIIGYDEGYFPTSAVCSTCGEPMPQCEPPFPTSAENITWFKAQFDLHIHRWHSGECANHAVARIV